MSLQQSVPALRPAMDAEIGRRVHMRMFDRRITGVALARALNVDQSGLSKRLRGERVWSAENLRDAAATLETTIAYLTGEVGDPSWCAPRDLNPEPIDSGPTDEELDAWLADVISIDSAPRFREAVPA